MEQMNLKDRLSAKVETLQTAPALPSSDYLALNNNTLGLIHENLKDQPLTYQMFDVVKSPSGGSEPFPQKRTQNRMKKPNKNTKIRCTAIRRRKRQVQLQSEQAKASRGQNGGGWCCKRLRDRQRHRPVQLPL